MKPAAHPILLGMIALSAVIFGVSQLKASPVTAEFSLAYAHVTGVRSSGSPGFTPKVNNTSSLAVPSFRVGIDVLPAWNLGFGYSYYSEIKSTGTGTMAIFPCWGEETIHELNADFRYTFAIADRLFIQAGPCLSVFFDRAEFTAPGSGLPILRGSVSHTDANVGAVAALRFRLDERWSCAVTCRYVAPKDHDVTLLSGSIVYRF